jgi:hypothetical protein
MSMTVPNSLNPLRIPDFNGDGRTDLFSFNSTTRTPEITLQAGVRVVGSSSLFSISEGWQDPQFGDFNGDSKTDLFWRNTKTGENAVWLMNGTTFSEAKFIDPLQGTWTSVVGDFDGNRKTDLFWYNANTGEYQIWIMDGLNRINLGQGVVGKGWEPTIADFNNDNRTDLFWREPTTGQNAFWTIDPQTLAIAGTFIESKPTTWRYEIVDYNGDGRSDIFWRDRLTGQNQVWIWAESGLQPNQTPIELPATSSDFNIQAADFEGDGRTDFLVRNPSAGTDQVWRFGETGVQITDLTTQSALFQSKIGDYNGDGFSDIRWTNTTGNKSSVIWFSDGFLPRPMIT